MPPKKNVTAGCNYAGRLLQACKTEKKKPSAACSYAGRLLQACNETPRAKKAKPKPLVGIEFGIGLNRMRNKK